MRSCREEMGLRPESVSEEIRIPTKTLLELESDDYRSLSAKIYGYGFLKKLLGFYSVPQAESKNILREFDERWSVSRPDSSNFVQLPSQRQNGPYLTLAKLTFGLGGLVLVFLASWLGFRLKSFVAVPKLKISNLEEGAVLASRIFKIEGLTEKESRLLLNGRELPIDEKGNFSEEIELLPGLNSLEFLVQNRFGKENRAIRNIVVSR